MTQRESQEENGLVELISVAIDEGILICRQLIEVYHILPFSSILAAWNQIKPTLDFFVCI